MVKVHCSTCLGMYKTEMCACLGMCTNMQCVGVPPICFLRCFSPWSIYHSIGLMCLKSGQLVWKYFPSCIYMTRSASTGCGERCACLGMCTNAMCRCPNVFSRCFSPWHIYHGIGLMSHQAG